MTSILILGLLIGMQHALEADHVAAVSSIVSGNTSLKRIITHGAVWGVGHTVTLMLVAGVAIMLGLSISAQLSGWLEFMIGVMLVSLGAHVIYRLHKDKIHFHFHRHGNAKPHLHAHSHAGDKLKHEISNHDHDHAKRLPVRTLLVGMMHGMAGSAALLVLTASSVQEPLLGLGYVVLFGVGSIVGMAALSAIIAVPLSYSARVLTWANRGIQTGIGFGTMALGFIVCFETGVLNQIVS